MWLMNATANNLSTSHAQPDPRRWRILAVLLLGIFVALIAVSIINVALPSIQHSLGATPGQSQWILAGYALTFGVVLVAAGRAGDMLGRGGLYLLGMTVYTLGAVAAGLAPSTTVLNIARLVMGIGAGLFNPQTIGMIQHYFAGAERGRAYGIFGSTVGVAVAIGPVVGGFLISAGGPDLGWRLTMLINVPFGIACILLGLLWFPRPLISRLTNATTGRSTSFFDTVRQLDPLGALLLGSAVLAVMLPFVGTQRPAWVWFLIPLAALLVAVWIWWEKRCAKPSNNIKPMVDLSVFRQAAFRNGALIAFIWFMGITSVWVLVALYFQLGLGYTALVTGLIGVPSAILSALSSFWSGGAVSRMGRSVVILGISLALTGIVSSAIVVYGVDRFGWSELILIGTLAIFGTGQGMVITPNQTLTLARIPQEYAGSVGGVLQTGQRIGTTVGIAVITGVAFSVQLHAGWTPAIITGWGIVVVFMLVALAVSIADLRLTTITRD